MTVLYEDLNNKTITYWLTQWTRKTPGPR